MVVQLTYDTFRGIRLSRWVLYTVESGEVHRALNSVETPGTVSARLIFELEAPRPTEAAFREAYPEARKVNSMADGSFVNPSVMVEPQPNATAFSVLSTVVATAGTPVQLSALAVPDGRGLVVTSDLKNDPKKVVYVATSSANALDPTKRVVLSPGSSVKLEVTNADLVWVDSDANAQKVVYYAEQ